MGGVVGTLLGNKLGAAVGVGAIGDGVVRILLGAAVGIRVGEQVSEIGDTDGM